MILVDTSVLIDFLKGIQNEGSSKLTEIINRRLPFGINSFILRRFSRGGLCKRVCATETLSLNTTFLSTERCHRFIYECSQTIHGMSP